jgi:multimeric flavodoxin WrbA
MKIGIIVYSETGHTRQVALEIKKVLELANHQVRLEEITVYNIASDKTLKDIPSMEGYDILILGTPVQGFSLPVPVQDYLKRTEIPKRQKLGVLMTQYFKVGWLGGNHTMRQLLSAVAYANPDLYGYGIVHWSSRRRETQIKDLVKILTNIE